MIKKRSTEDYKQLLKNLLPWGKAWNRDGDSILDQLMHTKGDELSRIDVRMSDLLKERDTRKTLELLIDHEEDLGLPDDCTELGATIAERRNIAHNKLIEIGGLNRQYYIDLMDDLGYGDIDIEEYTPFWSGQGTSGEACGDQTNIFYWKVNISIDPDNWFPFRAGMSLAGDRLLRVAGMETVRCILNRVKPAHTNLLFGYYLYAFDESFDSSFNSIPSGGDSGAIIGAAFSRAFSSAFDVYYGGGDFEFTAFDDSFSKEA